MEITNVNIVIWLWMAAYAYLLYVIVFFLYSHVTMTKRQLLLFMPAVLIWTVIETYFTCMPTSQFQYIMCNFFELSWLLPTVYMFTECFSYSLIRFSIVSWIANGISVVVMNIYNHQDFIYFSEKNLNEISWKALAIFTLSVVIVVVLEYPLMRKILPYKLHLTRVYRIAAGMYLLFVMVDFMIEINAAEEGAYVWRGTFKGLTALFLVALIVFLVALVKRRSVLLRKNQLETRIDILNSEYEHIVDMNRELHKVRHELNKQAEALRAVKGYVPEDVRTNIITKAGTNVEKSFSGMTLSGNLMIDTMLDKNYKCLEEHGILFETVLEPVSFSKEKEDDIVVIQEELFAFAKKFNDDCRWQRYSIRVRNGLIFIMLEIGIENRSAYTRRKLLDMIGDKMLVRQAFVQTYSLISKNDGSIDYELGKGIARFGVMIRM